MDTRAAVRTVGPLMLQGVLRTGFVHLACRHWKLDYIWNTHHHHDHTGARARITSAAAKTPTSHSRTTQAEYAKGHDGLLSAHKWPTHRLAQDKLHMHALIRIPFTLARRRQRGAQVKAPRVKDHRTKSRQGEHTIGSAYEFLAAHTKPHGL